MPSKNHKRILLLTAPRPDIENSPLHFGDNRPPLGLGYVAAYLEEHGHPTKIIDLYHFGGGITGCNPAVKQEESLHRLKIELDAEIQSFRPDFIGMYIHTMSFYTACDLGEQLKHKYPDILLMCGGPHPTVLPESIPACFDFVVKGEGEYAALDIVEGRNTQRIVQGVRVDDLDKLPWPDYDSFVDKPYNWKLNLFGHSVLDPVISLNTTRGCPFPCRFCGVRSISGPGFRGISADKLVANIVELRDKYDLKGVYFREDNFTTDVNRLRRFCELMIREKVDLKWACESRVRNLTPSLIKSMAEAGCCGLYIGVESGSPRMLEYMKKNETVDDFLEKFPVLHDCGIRTYSTWIYGLPHEKKEDRQLSDELLDRINPTSFDKFLYIGIPKSYFYSQMDRNKDYEFKEANGMIYPRGYLSLARQLYGESDPRNKYVEGIYSANAVDPIHIEL